MVPNAPPLHVVRTGEKPAPSDTNAWAATWRKHQWRLLGIFPAVVHDLPGGAEAMGAAERAFAAEVVRALADGCETNVAIGYAVVEAHRAMFSTFDAHGVKPTPVMLELLRQRGDDGAARALQQASAKAAEFAATLPPPARWAEFYDREVLPVWLRLAGAVRRCAECRALFVASDARQRFCSDACGARKRNRGRNTKRARDARARQHMETCIVCRSTGTPCAEVEKLLPSAKPSRRDAYSRRTVPYRDD